MNIFEAKGEKKTPATIAIPNAEELLRQGYEFFCGKDYQFPTEYHAIVEWLKDNKGKGLLLIGSNGRGKSVFCTKILPVLLAQVLKLKYYCSSAISLNKYIRDDNSFDILVSQVVIIDDFGIEDILNEYGTKRSTLAEVIDDAERRGQLVVLTTNLTMNEIKERYGMRTIDRLKALTTCVSCVGESFRH